MTKTPRGSPGRRHCSCSCGWSDDSRPSADLPAGLTDANDLDNSATDTDTPSNPGPNLGSGDGVAYDLADGGSITIALGTPFSGDGNSASPDLIYYEWFSGTQVMMDWVFIEVSDNHNDWFPIFFWGDNNADINTNVNINVIGGNEDDNRPFNPGDLYNTSGVTIDLDSLGLTGSYSYIRISAPQIGGSYGDNDGVGIDSIQPYP